MPSPPPCVEWNGIDTYYSASTACATNLHHGCTEALTTNKVKSLPDNKLHYDLYLLRCDLNLMNELNK